MQTHIKLLKSLLILSLIILPCVKALAQTDTSQSEPAQFPAKVNTTISSQPATPEKMPMDTLKTNKRSSSEQDSTNLPAQPKLKDSQLKAIIGNDLPAGKDAAGHFLYKNKSGRKYYVSDDGAKVYVK